MIDIEELVPDWQSVLNWPKPKVWLCSAALMVFGVTLTTFLIAHPKWQQHQLAQQQLKELKTQHQSLLQAQWRNEQAVLDLQALLQRKAESQQYLAPDKRISRISDGLYQFANQSGVRLMLLEWHDATQQQFWNERRLSLHIEGEYLALVDFAQQIQQHSTLLAVLQSTLGRASNDTTQIKAKLVLNAYFGKTNNKDSAQ